MEIEGCSNNKKVQYNAIKTIRILTQDGADDTRTAERQDTGNSSADNSE